MSESVRKPRLWPWLVGIAVVTAVAITAVVIAGQPHQVDNQGMDSETSSALGLTTSPSVPVPPSTSSSVVPEPPSPPHDFVPQAMPTSFGIVCGGETVIAQQGLTKTFRKPIGNNTEIIGNTKVVTNKYVLDIPGDTIALVQDDAVPGDNQTPWAALPGSEADTVLVWGHASAEPMVFNPIAEFTGDPSSCEATIELPGGELGFQHLASHMITPKGDEFNWSKGMSERPPQERKGKLLVVTCFDNDTEIAWEFGLKYSRAV